MFLQIQGEPIEVTSLTLFEIWNFPVTNTFTSLLIISIIIILLCLLANSFNVHNPSKFQIALESGSLILSNFIDQISGDKKVSKKIMPIVLTLVTYILISNLLLTLFPFLSGFTFEGKPMFRSATSDINITLSLAFGMVLLTQLFTIQKENILGFIFKFIQIDKVIIAFSKSIGDGLMSLVNALIGLLDIVSEFAKIISLSLRLFGNIFAGELLLGIFMTFLGILLPIPIIGLSVLSGIIQSIVFGALVTAYFTSVLKEN